MDKIADKLVSMCWGGRELGHGVRHEAHPGSLSDSAACHKAVTNHGRDPLDSLCRKGKVPWYEVFHVWNTSKPQELIVFSQLDLGIPIKSRRAERLCLHRLQE